MRQLGVDIARKGLQDEGTLALLPHLPRPTCFTRARGFYGREVCLAVAPEGVAIFVRRLLRHPRPNTQAKRLGTVVRASHRGLGSGDSMPKKNRNTLERRLTADGFDIATALSRDQYIPLDADETLSKFVVSGWPDEDRFNRLVNDLLVRARGHGRRVRAFGEMVAVLWAQGHNGATVRLEHLWHRLCQAEAFSLFCAYPRIGLTQDTSASFKEICATHTKVIGE